MWREYGMISHTTVTGPKNCGVYFITSQTLPDTLKEKEMCLKILNPFHSFFFLFLIFLFHFRLYQVFDSQGNFWKRTFISALSEQIDLMESVWKRCFRLFFFLFMSANIFRIPCSTCGKVIILCHSQSKENLKPHICDKAKGRAALLSENRL